MKCVRCKKVIPLQYGFDTNSLVLNSRTANETIVTPLCNECATAIFFIINHWLNKEEEEDAISRQAVLEYIEGSEAELGHSSENELVCQHIKDLPPVTLEQDPCGDCISRQAVIDMTGLSEWFDSSDSYNEFVIALSELPPVNSQEPKQNWIPCSERLPKPREDVWVNSDIGQIQGYYEEHVGVWYASFGQGRDYLELIVNAWMPLPENYKAESDG